MLKNKIDQHFLRLVFLNARQIKQYTTEHLIGH